MREFGCDFEHVVCRAGVPAGVGGDFCQGIIIDAYSHLAQSAFFIGKRATQERDDVLLGERLEHVNARAREQCGDDFEGRILGGCADQANVALFYVGKKGVLLSFIEAMNLIDKDNRPSAEVTGFRCIGHNLFDFLDSAENGGELNEVRLRDSRDDLRERCLSHSGRSPEDD